MNDTQTVIPPARPYRSTMIKNLMPRLPERGHVKIGELGETRKAKSGRDYQMPRKLDHFRVTTLERGEDGNFVRDEAIHATLGDEPIEIPIRLLYDQPDLNFSTRYAVYSGRNLWCSGDGETALRASKQPKDAPLPEPFTVQCPCHRQAPGYAGLDKCKPNGRLSFLIEGTGGVGGVYVFRTTSFNSVTGILSSLAFLRSVTGGILANIPLKLRIQPKQATNPTDQSSVLIYVVSVEFAGDVAELQQQAHQIALDRATTFVSIANIEEEARRNLALPGPADAALPGDIAEDIVAEFYPEQLGEAEPPPPRPTREQFADPPHDAETGEIIEPEPVEDGMLTVGDEPPEEEPEADIELLGDAITAAQAGFASFRKFWAGLSIDQRAVINPDRAKYQEIAEKADPARTDAQEKAPEATQAPQTASGVSTASAAHAATPKPVPHGTTVERADFWDTTSFAVEAPLKQDRSISFAVLRDKLMFLAEQAQSVDELDKYIADNDRNMRRLEEYSPAYKTGVIAKFDQVRKGLSG